MSKKPDTGDPSHNLWTVYEQRYYEAVIEYDRHRDYYDAMPHHPDADDEALDRWRVGVLDWSTISQ